MAKMPRALDLSDTLDGACIGLSKMLWYAHQCKLSHQWATAASIYRECEKLALCMDTCDWLKETIAVCEARHLHLRDGRLDYAKVAN